MLPKRLLNTKTKNIINTEKISPLNYNKYKYVTLSYVWGKENYVKPKKMKITGINYKICFNKYTELNKLLQMLHNNNIEWLWVDAICINQNDVEEKNIEVSKMSKYYENSQYTIAFIITEINIVEIIEEIMNEKEISIKNKFLKILNNDLFLDEWFERVWILQESILSNDLLLYTGNEYLFKLKDFFIKIYNYLYLKNEDDILRINFFNHINPSLSVLILGIARFSIENKINNLTGILHYVRGRKCKYLQDKIYGLLGLYKYSNEIIVNYEKDINEIISDIIKISIRYNDYSFLIICKEEFKNVILYNNYQILNKINIYEKSIPDENINMVEDIYFKIKGFKLNINNFIQINKIDIVNDFDKIKKVENCLYEISKKFKISFNELLKYLIINTNGTLIINGKEIQEEEIELLLIGAEKLFNHQYFIKSNDRNSLFLHYGSYLLKSWLSLIVDEDYIYIDPLNKTILITNKDIKYYSIWITNILLKFGFGKIVYLYEKENNYNIRKGIGIIIDLNRINNDENYEYFSF